MSKRTVPSLDERASGLLLHPTSLPGPHGCGDLGEEARTFARFLFDAQQRWWQMLPIGPVGYGNSPYSALSAFAGNPLLLDLDSLHSRFGTTLHSPGFPQDRVDYAATSAFRHDRLLDAFMGYQESATPDERAEYEQFAAANSSWLDDWSLYASLKDAHAGAPWIQWAPPLRDRDPDALDRARREHASDIAFHSFLQWQFERQWAALRQHCEALGIGLIGDLPIFVAHDSADVWAHRELFLLKPDGHPSVVAGVPPDYFSATGQRWGNPLYDWPRLAEQGFSWWIERLRNGLRRFHALRLDHFIGFQRYWEIPSDEPTAVKGVWSPGPGEALFDAVLEALGEMPLIAENLGVVTPEVEALRRRYGFPGLRILQFAFGEDPNASDFKPHNYERQTVVYTGTHDNDTTVGWFNDRGGPDSVRTPEQTDLERQHALAYLNSDGREIHWDMIRAAQVSVANLALIPAQDVLGLGSEARMNRPGQPQGNWEWRLTPGALGDTVAARLAEFARLYDR